MNAFVYAMFIFVKMQNCVKWQTDTCLSVQNAQKEKLIFSTLHNAEERKAQAGKLPSCAIISIRYVWSTR